MQERRKTDLAQKRAYIAIIVGIITIILFIGGSLVGIVAWKDTQEFNIKKVMAKDIEQDARLQRLEDMTNETNIELGKINTGIDYIKESLKRLESK